MLVNIQKEKVSQGASTITQQLTKDLFLTPERSFSRKAKELILAIWLDFKLSKEQILTLYLNRAYMGAGTYGISAASKRYFNKKPIELSLPESALIAGLLKAPSRYAPTNNIEKARARAKVVLGRMLEEKYITQGQYDNAIATPANVTAGSSTESSGYYIDWIISLLPNYIETIEDDIVIYAPIDNNMQEVAQAALASNLLYEGKKQNASQGAFMVMDHNGAVLAMVGGYDYKSSQFNRVTQSKRQPGSAFKPFIYLTAFEYGFTPTSILKDTNINFGGYKPENYNNKYKGDVTLNTAFAESINTIPVWLTKQLGVGKVKNTAYNFGIETPLHSDLSLALGTAEVTPLELTTAYNNICNSGKKSTPYGIVKIETKNGELLYQKTETAPETLSNKNYINMLKSMMRNVVSYGTGKNASLGNDIFVMGKTGTSSSYRDAWFIGCTNELTASVWVGNDDFTAMKNITGGSLPAKIWKNFMQAFALPTGIPDLNYGAAPIIENNINSIIENDENNITDPQQNIEQQIPQIIEQNTMQPIENENIQPDQPIPQEMNQPQPVEEQPIEQPAPPIIQEPQQPSVEDIIQNNNIEIIEEQ
jgi:penicillin-binding protein 1A